MKRILMAAALGLAVSMTTALPAFSATTTQEEAILLKKKKALAAKKAAEKALKEAAIEEAKLKKAKTMTVGMAEASGKPMNVKLSLEGFAEALATIQK